VGVLILGDRMVSNVIERAKIAYGALIDPALADASEFLDVGPDSRADEVSDDLAEVFRKDPTLTAVMIRIDGRNVGVSTPARVRRAVGTASRSYDGLGSSEGATLPGRSTRYRPIWFACPRHGERVAKSFYDERYIPLCPKDQSILMEVQP
jgi:hypothetical protein